MTSDTTKDEWSVWMAQVMFDDGIRSKERPVVVLSDRVVLCICMGVTSKYKGRDFGYKLKKWEYAGLTNESWVRFEYLELKHDMFRRRVGMLHDDDIQGIQDWLNDLAHGNRKYSLR